MRAARLLTTMLLCLLPLGCGSKITEANYYRVQHGMSEEDVEDLLGPNHAQSVEAAVPASSSDGEATTRPARVVKTWSRGALDIHVTFENGVVVARSADGIEAEKTKACAIRPTSQPSAAAE
jgi:hypothetical protein